MQEGSDEITDEGTIATFNGAAGFKCLSVSFHYKKKQSV